MELVSSSLFKPSKDGIEFDRNLDMSVLKGFVYATLNDEQLGRFKDALKTPEHWQFIVRSSLCQVGLDAVINTQAAVIDNNELIVPADLQSFRPKDENWYSTVRKMGELELGRWLITEEENFLTQAEIIDAMRSRLIACDATEKEVDETGRLQMGIREDIEYIFNTSAFEKHTHRKAVLKGGRAGLRKYRANKQNPGSTFKPGELLISGIDISTGPFGALLDKDIHPGVRHLGARWLDPLRSTGRKVATNEVRQLELLRNGDEEEIRRSDVKARMRFVKPTPTTTSVFLNASLDKRDEMHEKGVRLMDIIGAPNKDMDKKLSSWFAGIGANVGEDICGVVVSKTGCTDIPWAEDYGWQKDAMNDAILHGERNDDMRYREIQEAIPHTASNGATIITHQLPSASHLDSLVTQCGVRCIVFRGIESTKPVFQNNGECLVNDFYLNQGKHQKLMELTKKYGCQFVWWPLTKDGNEKPRVFNGMAFTFIDKEEKADISTQNTVGLAQFGSSREVTNTLLHEDFVKFGEGLAELQKKLGLNFILQHGNGPGVMNEVIEMGLRLRILLEGFGMNFEQNKEQPDFRSDSLLLFQDDQIEYRQTLFEKMHTFPIGNLGGIGSYFEYILTLLNVGINKSVPMPLILVDPRGERYEHFYLPLKQQIEKMSASIIADDDNRWGEKAKGKSLTPAWLNNTIFLASSYDEVLQILNATLSDITSFWKTADIPPEVINKAFKAHEKKCSELDIRIPEFLVRGHWEYCKHLLG